MKALKTLLMLSLVVLFGVSGVVAQDQSGQIFGNVTTEDGAVIVGAKVTLASSSLIRPLSARTNERGSYVFPSIPIGTYTVTFEAEKYQGMKMENVTIMAGAKMRVNATMKSGVVGEEIVTITGDAPLIDVKSNQTGMAISKELFKVLPKGRNFTTMVTLAPGAVDDGIGDGIMIDGASASENVWVIDGVDVTSFYTGKPTTSAVFEFIEEIQVRSGGYEAEFGGSMGGVVNVVTRSGGNEFHGEGSLYINNDSFDADPRPTLRFNPVDDEVAEYITYNKDAYDRYEFGGAIGGYVLKDRIWFFGSYMPVFNDITRTVDFRNSLDQITLTQDYDQEQRTHRASIKLTGQLTDQIRVSASYLNDWYKWMGSLPAADGVSSAPTTTPGYDEKGATQPGWDMAGSLDYSITDWLFFNAKGGWHYQDYNQHGANAEPRRVLSGNMSVFSGDPAFAQIPAQYVRPSGYSSRPGEYATDHDIQKKYNVSGDLTFFGEAAGSHTLKGGVQFFHIYQDIASAYSADYVIFYWDRTFTNQFTGVSGRGKYGYYRVVTAHPGGYGTVAETESDRWGLFLQDSWSVTDRLTLNLGIRTEKEDIPSFSDLPEFQDPPITFDFDQKLAPRLGFAYDFYGDGTLKIFGNWARYFDVMKLAMAEGSYGGFKWRDRYFGLDTLEWWTIGTTGFGTWPRDMSKYPGAYYGEIDWRIPSFETTDPDLEPTSIDEYIVGGDYLLADDLGLSMRFVHKRLRYIIEDVGIYTDHGEEYFISNPGYGYSVSKLSGGFPPTQKAKRHYWGWETRLNKRFSNNWAGGVNLTISRLTGNVSGLASSDEFGRDDPNVNRYFDNWVMSYDASWNPIDGVLPTDRRYVATIFGSYTFDFGLIAGVTQTIQDGTPISTQIDLNGLDGYMPYNRGDLGRMDMYTQTDLYLEYNFKFDQYTAQVNLNVSNLFDQDTAWRKNVEKDRDNPAFTEDELLAYYQSKTPIPESAMFLPGGTSRYNPAFLMDNGFQGPRSIRLGFKFLF